MNTSRFSQKVIVLFRQAVQPNGRQRRVSGGKHEEIAHRLRNREHQSRRRIRDRREKIREGEAPAEPILLDLVPSLPGLDCGFQNVFCDFRLEVQQRQTLQSKQQPRQKRINFRVGRVFFAEQQRGHGMDVGFPPQHLVKRPVILAVERKLQRQQANGRIIQLQPCLLQR